MARKRAAKPKKRGTKVKPHTRSPRGPNRGKPTVTVKGHGRSKPRKKR